MLLPEEVSSAGEDDGARVGASKLPLLTQLPPTSRSSPMPPVSEPLLIVRLPFTVRTPAPSGKITAVLFWRVMFLGTPLPTRLPVFHSAPMLYRRDYKQSRTGAIRRGSGREVAARIDLRRAVEGEVMAVRDTCCRLENAAHGAGNARLMPPAPCTLTFVGPLETRRSA